MSKNENSFQVVTMRRSAIMAGISALSDQFPDFIPLDQRPSPASDYLYDSIIISSIDGHQYAQQGLKDFLIFLIDQILEKKILPEPVEFPISILKDGKILRSIRSAIRQDKIQDLPSLKYAFVYPNGGIGSDSYENFILRKDVFRNAELYLRCGVVDIIDLFIDISNSPSYDWWHALGNIIGTFANGYMASEWSTRPTLRNPHFDSVPEQEKDCTFKAYQNAFKEHNQARWPFQEKLFVRLGECIGDRAGRRPYKNPEWTYPTL